MEISKYIEWFLTSMIFQYGSLAYDIEREVCLETPFTFAMEEDSCDFSLAEAKKVFESEIGDCLHKCHIKISNLKRWNKLTTIFLSFNRSGEDQTSISRTCSYSYSNEITFNIIFKTEGSCVLNKDCNDVNKICLLTGQIGTCVCRPGYIGFGNECLQGNLKLNEKCKRNEQCSVAFGSVCQDGTCVCRRGYSPFNETECFLSDISENLCNSTKKCKDVSKMCLLTGQIGECVCNPGYIGFGNKCLKGNLKLNETCQRNEQCSNVTGSFCQNETCVCTQGYTQLNDSECIFSSSSSDGNFQARFQNQREDNVAGLTIGSVFGGLVLGVVLTMFALTIYHHIRRGKAKKKECPKDAIFNNTTYETEVDASRNIPAIHRKNERKIVNVSPFPHSIDSPTKRNVQEDRKRSMADSDVNNEVYNHLHEKEADPDVDENYDHAHGNLNHAMEESDYSNLNTERKYAEHDVSVSNDNDYYFQEPASDYCSLKNEK